MCKSVYVCMIADISKVTERIKISTCLKECIAGDTLNHEVSLDVILSNVSFIRC